MTGIGLITGVGLIMRVNIRIDNGGIRMDDGGIRIDNGVGLITGLHRWDLGRRSRS